jgi:competence protein ComEC
LVVGVPVLFLTSLALLTGFLLLLFAPLLGPLVAPFAWVTDFSLAGCDWILTSAERWPLGYWYVPDVPSWWLACFYLMLVAALVLPELRRRPRPVALVLLVWLCLGLTLPLLRPGDGQFRCTFLAVGHGTCVVLELPDGRTMLYDAGSLSGPEVSRRQIAPFLWHRGIRRLDEVFCRMPISITSMAWRVWPSDSRLAKSAARRHLATGILPASVSPCKRSRARPFLCVF